MLVQKKKVLGNSVFLDTLLLNINSMAAGSAATNNHFQSKCKSKSKKEMITSHYSTTQSMQRIEKWQMC